MPPSDTKFVIIGLTKGLAFTKNPCLQSQVQWATSRSKPTQAYGMATYPTAAQLTQYGASGPWRTTTLAGRLSNVGYAEAKYSVAYMQAIGWKPSVVWIDVEPRPAQPWPTGTDAKRALNRAVIDGFMRGLSESGYSYGFYSYTNGWNEIVGNWKLPNVPVWATAGRLDYPTEALDRCTQPSFSGGKVLISQWYDDTRDYDRTCGTYQFTSFSRPMPPMTGFLNDVSGDWRSDLLARASDGVLWRYAGDERGQFAPAQRVGPGWGVMNLVEVTGDLSGDGIVDFVAREARTGYLYLYTGFSYSRYRVGTGWNGMRDIAGVGDISGDGRADLLAMDGRGDLWLYRGDVFTSTPRLKIGHGWLVMDKLIAAGDFNGDGHADLMARETATGYLWLYPGDGAGRLSGRVRIGTGWNVMDLIEGSSDLNGDRVPDLLARNRNTGELWLYPGNGTGGFSPRTAVRNPAGGTWSGVNLIA